MGSLYNEIMGTNSIETSRWEEMSYNRSYNPWDIVNEDDDDYDDYDCCVYEEEEDEDGYYEDTNVDIATGMELYILASVVFDGADIIISEEE